MPTRAHLAETRARLRIELLARIAQGATLAAACAAPHMPRHTSVCRWAAEDPAFRAELREAQRRGEWVRRFAFDEDVAREVLARLAQGATLTDLRRDPAMPRPSTLAHWRATQGWFGAEVLRLLGLHKADRTRRHFRAEPRAFDPTVADRVLLHLGRGCPLPEVRHREPGLPGYWVIDRWRRQNPAFDAEVRATVAIARRSLARRRALQALPRLRQHIAADGSLHSLAGRHGLPSLKTLYRWVSDDPAFAAEVAQACEVRDEHLGAFIDAAMARARNPTARSLIRLALGPRSRQRARLRNRPGKKWRR